MTTQTTELMRGMMGKSDIVFSDVDQDVFAPVEIQGKMFDPAKAQEFIDGAAITRT